MPALPPEYLDEGVSGSRESRPALNRLMNDAKQRKFDILLVWKIDRFGRSLKHLVNSLAELESIGIAFVSFRDSLDLSSAAGRLMAQLLGAISEFESSLITERVNDWVDPLWTSIAAECSVCGVLGPRYERSRHNLAFPSAPSTKRSSGVRKSPADAFPDDLPTQ